MPQRGVLAALARVSEGGQSGATIAFRGQGRVQSGVTDAYDRTDVRALTQLIDARLDDECERIYPGVRSGSARIKLRDGTVLEKRVLEPIL